MTGHSTAAFTGIVYAPGALLDLTGGSTMSVAGTRGIAGLILSDLAVTGGSDLSVDF